MSIPTDTTLAVSPELLRSLVVEQLEDDKAEDIIVIELSGKSSLADYMVVASGSSARHVGAMAMHLDEKLSTAGAERVTTEGMPQNDWVLIDSGDVIVHLFRPEVRAFYQLEKMWGATTPASLATVEGMLDASFADRRRTAESWTAAESVR